MEGKELWFRYEAKGKDVLRGLSLSVRRGELLSLLGGNGAGKSTLLRVLCGLKKPLRGNVKMEKGMRLGHAATESTGTLHLLTVSGKIS